MEKICFKCSETKDLSKFYKHKKMADGTLNKCIDCTKKDVKQNWTQKLTDPVWVINEKKRHREKYHRLNKNWNKNYDSKIGPINYYQKYPEKLQAKRRVSKIKSELEHKHHWSYNEEHYCDIIHLTMKDHYKAHRFIIYDQERMMYRTLSGILLDTKEKHLQYILDKIKNEED